jgi:hypothetical protein
MAPTVFENPTPKAIFTTGDTGLTNAVESTFRHEPYSRANSYSRATRDTVGNPPLTCRRPSSAGYQLKPGE